MMRKRFVLVSLSLILVFIHSLLFVTEALAAKTSYKLKETAIELFGELTLIDQAIIPRNRYTFVPASDLMEPIGYELTWDEKKETLTAKSKALTVQLKVGSKSVYLNKQKKRLPISPKLIQRRVFIPLRQFSELIGLTFQVDPASNVIRVNGAKVAKSTAITVPPKMPVEIKKSLETSAQTAPLKGLFWRAQKNNKVIYLVAHPTLHPKAIGTLPERISKALQSSNRMVVETNLLNTKQMDIQQWIAKYGVISDQRKLQDLLNEAQLKIVTDQLKSLNLSLEQFETLEPWLAMLLISQFQIEKSMTVEFDASAFDLQLLEQAKKDQKQIFEFHSVEDVLIGFDQMPTELQVEYVKSILETKFQVVKSNPETIKSAWLSGDLKNFLATVTSSNDQKTMWQTYLDHLYSTKASEKLISMSEKENAPLFAIISPVHLTGDTNVLALLQKAGFTVTKE